jgi:hypothetical protein
MLSPRTPLIWYPNTLSQTSLTSYSHQQRTEHQSRSFVAPSCVAMCWRFRRGCRKEVARLGSLPCAVIGEKQLLWYQRLGKCLHIYGRSIRLYSSSEKRWRANPLTEPFITVMDRASTPMLYWREFPDILVVMMEIASGDGCNLWATDVPTLTICDDAVSI